MNLASEGLYLGNFNNMGLDTSSKGTPCLDIVFDINHILDETGDDWAAIEEPFQRHVKVYLSDASWEMSKKRLTALQYNGDFDNPDITHEPVQLTCKHEEYQGKLTEKWDLAEFATRERQAPNADEIRKLKARWNSDQQASKKPAGKPATPRQQKAKDNAA